MDELVVDVIAERDCATVYKELWAHIRHIESQRLNFTSLYLATYGIGIASICKGDIKSVSLQYILLGYLVAFSFIGMSISTRTLVTFWIHYRDVTRLQARLDPDCFRSYEEDNDGIYAYIAKNEPAYCALNRFFIRICGGQNPMPLTLMFPMFYLVGGIIAILMMIVLPLLGAGAAPAPAPSTAPIAATALTGVPGTQYPIIPRAVPKLRLHEPEPLPASKRSTKSNPSSLAAGRGERN